MPQANHCSAKPELILITVPAQYNPTQPGGTSPIRALDVIQSTLVAERGEIYTPSNQISVKPITISMQRYFCLLPGVEQSGAEGASSTLTSFLNSNHWKNNITVHIVPWVDWCAPAAPCANHLDTSTRITLREPPSTCLEQTCSHS